MAVDPLPSYAKIVEARLAIDAPDYGAQSPLSGFAQYGQRVAEMWRGQLLFAAMSRPNALAFAAFLAGLDGRVAPFLLPAKDGYLSRSLASPVSGTLSGAAVRGADTVLIATANTGITVKRGTLLGIGDPQSAQYQLCEALEQVTSAATFTVRVAPRIRYAFAGGTAVVFGAVSFKLLLASDELTGLESTITHGNASIDVVEHVA